MFSNNEYILYPSIAFCVAYQILISMTGWGRRPYKLSTPVPQFGGSHVSRLWPDNRSSGPGPLPSPKAY